MTDIVRKANDSGSEINARTDIKKLGDESIEEEVRMVSRNVLGSGALTKRQKSRQRK